MAADAAPDGEEEREEAGEFESSRLEAALKEHVITVPGSFFDINPGKRRADHTSRFRQYLRFSFGPDEASVTTAVERIKAMVARAGVA